MRGLLLFLLLLLGLWYAVSGYWYVCKIKNKCAEQTVVVKEKPAPAPSKKVVEPEPVKMMPKNSVPFSIVGMPFVNKSGENIYFNASGRNAAFPVVPDELRNQFQEIKDYLDKNPSKAIEVTGLYTSDDDKPSTYDNLGVARAENTKLQLLKIGIQEAQVTTKGQLANRSIKTFEDKLTGAITTKIIEKPKPAANEKEKELKAIEDQIKAAPKTVYFETNSSRIIKTADLKKYVENLNLYLKANPDIKIRVIGHTDNIGSPIKNRELGLKRAIYVKEYLTENGINQNQVKASSEGPDKPIASNKTSDGRKRNRRVDISF